MSIKGNLVGNLAPRTDYGQEDTNSAEYLKNNPKEEIQKAQKTADDALPKKGGTMTGDIDMGSNRIKNVATPTEDGHAVPKKYVDDKDTKSVPITLTASGWSASAPYTQSVEVNGLTDKLFAEAYPAWPDDAEAEKTLQEETAKVSSCRRSGSTLTFRCLVDKPAVDIPVMVEVHT